MVFLQKDHHAVGQLHSYRLLRLERRQRRRLHLVPRLDLRRAPHHGHQHKAEQRLRKTRLADSHYSAPLLAAGAGSFFAVWVWITPTVRLFSENTWFETRRISALVTLSTRSK